MKRPILRYLVSILFSVSFSLAGVALATAAVKFLHGGLPTAAFLIIAVFGSALAAAYGAMIAQNKFNGAATTVGAASGAVVAMLTANPAVIASSVLPALFTAATVAFFATLVFSKPKIFLWYGPLITGLHILQSGIIILAVAYSLFQPWLRPFMLLIAISGFTIWNRRLMDGCPLTRIEDEIYEARDKKTRYGSEGFIAYYMNKVSGRKIPRSTYTRTIICIAAGYLLFFLISLHFHF